MPLWVESLRQVQVQGGRGPDRGSLEVDPE